MIIYLKSLKSSKFVRVKAFPMYGGIGVSAPSLHRESTDSECRACTIMTSGKAVAYVGMARMHVCACRRLGMSIRHASGTQLVTPRNV